MPQLAVVALLGLLQVAHVLVQLLLLEERRAVDAGEHLALGVAAPVGAGQLRQLESADLAGGGQVRPAAQVGELADGVGGDNGVLGKLGDELKLERLIREDLLGLGAGDHAALEGFVGFHDLGHTGLDGGEVVRRKRAIQLDVVIEAVLDGGAHAELHVAVEVDERGGHDVRSGVTQKLETLVALGRDDGHGVARVHGCGEVDRLVVHDAGQRGLRQARADGGCHVGNGGAFGHVFGRAVGKYDVHISSFPVPGAHKAPARSVRSERTARPPMRQNNEAAPWFTRRLR